MSNGWLADLSKEQLGFPLLPILIGAVRPKGAMSDSGSTPVWGQLGLPLLSKGMEGGQTCLQCQIDIVS